MDEDPEARQLVDPPEIERRFSFHRYQCVGIPVLALVPALALAGVFEEQLTRSTARNNVLTANVIQPSRARYGRKTTLEVLVRNDSPDTLESVVVRLDPKYLDRFASVTIIPVPRHAFEVVVESLRSGENRRIAVELEPRDYWAQEGIVDVIVSGRTPLTLALRTWVFP
jgi:hypothetical protein